ncbi:related to TIF4631 - mRNA cap-binding protein (eIF4F), 150K subunit [Pseudozyma flocculosa]|uniref:Related to TIF4631 - mRNA cap-binding protein (eIF4F), 150K subunit n=1 Tax=Pseudozyma flocculosa TaxID=84751 RepID=A0A5C3FB38_9BASI|nr:related to TIF4631 - mRNA cap-binding protein (eIF4F), 150K subunit [Pseudozyma flocculosa]
MSTESNPAGSIQNASAGSVNGDAASHSRRQSAVSLPKGANSGSRAGQAINFGSVHDQNAMLSSSPAVQPSSGQHLGGEKPTVFGSVTAHDSESKKTTIGFASGKGDGAAGPAAATGAAPRSLDFQKLFQGSGSPAQPAGNAAAGTGSGSPQAQAASAAAPPAGSPVAGAQAPATQQMPRHPPSNLRPPTGAGHHNGPRPFEPSRSPSQHHGQGARVPSQGGPHQGFAPHPAHGHPQGGPQQPRSPHMANAAPMQPMQPMGGPWGQPQQPMGYPPQYGYHPGYGYQPVPPQHWGQQQQAQGYEMPGTPRSPRHANMSSSPMGPNGLPPTPSMAPSTPLSARASANVPPSPQTAHSSVASPPHHGAPLAMGQPQPGRPQGFASPSPSFAHHSPSHSFSNPMSPSARHFEPQQKRQSSAIRIVNPETQAAVDLQSLQRTPTSTPAQPAASTSSPSLAKASPAVVTPAERKPVRMETPEAFMRRVEAKKAEDAKKKAELEAAAGKSSESDAAAAAAAAAKQKETDEQAKREKDEQDKKEAEEKAAKERAEKEAADAKQKAEAEEVERQKKAKQEEEEKAAAAAKREAEEKAAADKKAADEAKAKEEAERKEREAKEAEEKAKADAAAAAAKEKADAEAAAAAAAAKKAADEEQAAAAARAKEADEATTASKPKPAPIDTQSTAAAAEGVDGDDKDKAANAESAAAAAFRVADVERMAREASSVPSTPLDALPPRTPGAVPQTPRTPGTPGFAGLPAKPLSSLPPTNGIKLDNDALEKKKRAGAPGTIDTSSAQQAPHGDAPASAASNALGSARFIDNINKVSYPSNIASPRAELNESAEPGKFRYDRDFLMQFMGVYTEKPQDLPPLASIGMEGGMGAGGRPGGGGRRASGMGPPPPPGGRAQGLGISGSSNFGGKGAGIGAFSHPPKTSEERFAASSGSRGPGGMGAFGPMGSFTAGARSQPLSRTGSGSAALPSRDMMGTGIPQGGRTKSNRGRQRDPNTSRGPQVNPPEKGGPTIPLDQVVPLANSENRWQPQGRASTVKPDSPEMVQRKVKALLNKLTLEKFDSISTQILDWANKSVNENDGRTLRQVIQLIFEKATDEAAWSEMYARLCRKIMEDLSNDVKDENLRTADGKAVVGGALFRKYLLNRCQEDFERGWAQRDDAVAAAKSKEAEDKAKKESNDKAEDEAREAVERGEQPSSAPKEAELLSDEYYEAQKAKRRGLGLVKFIGELFKLSMLTERIMHLCIKKLLSNATDPEEEEIESLCKLMTTVGKLLDTDKARGHMDVYFTRMREMANNEASINSRMRFMLLDVIELRDSHWTPRHDNSAPKTIAQIHADAAKAKQQQEAEAAARQSRGGPMSRGGSKRGQARGEHGPDGWSTVGGPPAPPRPAKVGDLSAFGKIERGGSNRPLSFGGPGGVFAKKNQNKGSEDGSQPPTRTNSTTNMFSLLNQSGDNEGAAAPAEEPQRPKLNLLPRTKPVPEADKPEAKADKAEMSDEEAKRKIGNDVKEFLEIKDVNEGLAAYKELPSNRRSEFIDKIVGTALEKNKDAVDNVAALLAKLSSEDVLDEATAFAGFEPHMEFLEDASIDIPNIYPFMASLLVSSKLSQDKIEELGAKIEGEGIKTPKDKLLEKVAAARESSAGDKVGRSVA